MACNPAPTCKAALAEASRVFPGRSTASDGICPSAAHTKANPDSDHETGNAFDLTNDPASGCDAARLTALLVGRKDSRVKYVIHNRMIYGPGSGGGWAGKAYTGSNPHTSHMHVSIYETARNSESAWWGKQIDTGNKGGSTIDGGTLNLDLPGPVDEALELAQQFQKLTSSLGKLGSFISSGETWLRVAMFVGGGFVLVVALVFFIMGSKRAETITETVTAVASKGQVDLDGPTE